MSIEPGLLVLGPVDATDPDAVIEGTMKVVAGCGHECWLAQGSMEHFFTEGMDSKCVPCFGGNEAVAQSILEGKGEPADPAELLRELLKLAREKGLL